MPKLIFNKKISGIKAAAIKLMSSHKKQQIKQVL
jgi:hypothetical protein